MLIVTISWPQDPDRGTETYGPFASTAARDTWVDQCMEATAEGWELLSGAHYLLTSVAEPFDPTSLWELKA